MVLRDQVIINVVEAEVERVDTHRLLALLHGDHVNFTQCVPGFQGHEVVERLSYQDLHLVRLAQILNPVSYLAVW